jgi:hypothetical protein
VFLVGYPKETKGHYFYNKSENKVFVARDGVFLEKDHLSKMTSGRKIELDEVREDEKQCQPDKTDNLDALEASKKTGQNQTDKKMLNRLPFVGRQQRSQPDRCLGIVLTDDQDILVIDGDEPSTYKQAMTSPDSAKWQEAMRSEMDSMS